MALSALVALALAVLPLPTVLEAFRPDFLVLVVFYWCIESPRAGGLTLVGFLRDGRFNVYSGAERLAEPLEQRAQTRAETALLLLNGKRLLVGPSGVTMGRSRQCDVVLDDPNVSRQHAEVRPRGGSWVLTDLGSTNGSRLNGRDVERPEVLRSGDEIELGATVMRFEVE